MNNYYIVDFSRLSFRGIPPLQGAIEKIPSCYRNIGNLNDWMAP